MKTILILISICIMTSSMNFGQDKKTQNVLNETWSWDTVDGLSDNRIKDSVSQTILRPKTLYSHKSCPKPLINFNADYTFKIVFGIYGESMGYQYKIFEGQYMYDSISKEILLIFKDETFFDDLASIPYRVLKGLSTGSPPWFSFKEMEEAPVYTKTFLKIAEESGEKIKVDLYAYTKKNKKTSFGSVIFIRRGNNEEK